MAASGASQLGQTTASILIAVFILGLFAFYKRTKRPDGFPPGPSSLPIFGSFLGKYLIYKFCKMYLLFIIINTNLQGVRLPWSCFVACLKLQ